MFVRQILNAKGKDGVVTVAPGTSLQQVAELLSSRRIGAVVVSGDGRHVAGILSERDIVRELGRRGPSCLSAVVDSVMTVETVSCTMADSADFVLDRMTRGRFRHMPVVEDGAMIGLISIGDVVAARLSQLSMEKDALEGMIKGF